MRRLAWLALLALPAWGQQPAFPRFAVAPRACDASSRGFTYFNTTDSKPYVCNGSAWTDVTATTTVDTAAVEAALPVSDATELVKGSVTSSKRARLEVDGLSAAVTRVINVPDSDTTLPIASQVITFAGPTAARTYTFADSSYTIPGLSLANVWGSTNSFIDGNFSILGSGDPTKILKLEADSAASGTSTVTVTASTTVPIASQAITLSGPSAARTVTLPDSNFTVAGLGTTNAFSSTNSFIDGSLSVIGSSDATKVLKFEVDGFTAGNTRTVTVPDASFTAAGLGLSQTFSGTNLHTGREDFGTAADAVSAIALNETAGQITFEGAAADTAEHRVTATVNSGFDTLTTIPAGGTLQTVAVLENTQTFGGTITFGIVNLNNNVTVNGGAFVFADNQVLRFGGSTPRMELRLVTAFTPDAPAFALGTTANSAHVIEIGDIAFDFNNCSAGTGAATDPIFCVHSHNQTTTQWLDLSHNATNGVINVGLGGLDAPGHLGAHGTAPTVSACGTSPGTVTGNDSYGRVTTGSGGTVQSCTLTFATAYAVAPACVANDETGILLVRAVATTTTVVIDSAVAGTLASQVLTYQCRGL